MADTRQKDKHWQVANSITGKIYTDGEYNFGAVTLAVLMDIRDELKGLNGLLRCPNFMDIPHILRRVSKNTAKKRRKKAK